MSKPIDWRLIFRFEETIPGQRFTCVVQLRYPFRGSFLVFDNAAAFAVRALNIGNVNHMVQDHLVPAVVLQSERLVLPIGMRGQNVELEMVNIESDKPEDLAKRMVKGTRERKTHIRPTPFRAELYGKILLGSEDETPKPTLLDGPVVEVDKTN